MDRRQNQLGLLDPVRGVNIDKIADAINNLADAVRGLSKPTVVTPADKPAKANPKPDNIGYEEFGGGEDDQDIPF